jgi:CheY-like chemotaxis protein
MRVLLLEDEPPLRAKLQSLLEGDMADCEVVATATVDEALASLRPEPPDLLLVDVVLSPDPAAPDGLAFVERARADGVDAPLILMSSVVPELLQQLSLRARALSWWAKSVARGAFLCRLVRETLRDPPHLHAHLHGMSERSRLGVRQLRIRARAQLPDEDRSAAELSALVKITASLAREAIEGPEIVLSALASELGIARSTLEGYGPLARWTAEDIQMLFTLVGKGGARLSVSHLLEAASLTPQDGTRVLRDALHRGWSPKEIRAHLRERGN